MPTVRGYQSGNFPERKVVTAFLESRLLGRLIWRMWAETSARMDKSDAYWHTHTHVHAHAHTHVHTHPRACTRTHTHTHACTHARTHAHTHTHTCKCSLSSLLSTFLQVSRLNTLQNTSYCNIYIHNKQYNDLSHFDSQTERHKYQMHAKTHRQHLQSTAAINSFHRVKLQPSIYLYRSLGRAYIFHESFRNTELFSCVRQVSLSYGSHFILRHYCCHYNLYYNFIIPCSYFEMVYFILCHCINGSYSAYCTVHSKTIPIQFSNIGTAS